MTGFNYSSFLAQNPTLVRFGQVLLALTFVAFLSVTLNQSLNAERKNRVERVLLQSAPVQGPFEGKEEVGNGPVVGISSGKVRGKALKSRAGREFNAFYKLPYAEPPVGEYKFQPPRKLETRWEGIRDATDKGGSEEECLQFKGTEVGGKEDCLKLAVFTPKLPSGGQNPNLPVMFYILGGAFLFGRTNRYGADYIMDEDVVLVLVEFRYGPFGHLSTEDMEIRGNMAYKDQVMAMRWVQENIAKFGGDPKRVMLFGNSSGAASIHAHILSFMNQGLFHRAVSQSGTTALPPGKSPRPRDTAQELGRKLNCTNVEDTKALHRCLIEADGAAIVSNYALLPDPLHLVKEAIPEDGDRSEVFMEGYPMRKLHGGQFQKNVSWILGFNSAEALPKALGILSDPSISSSLDSYWDQVSPRFLHFEDDTEHSAAKRLRKQYFGDKEINNDTRYELVDLLSDIEWAHPIVVAGNYHARNNGGQAYMYYLSKEPIISYGESSKGDFSPPFGVCHADEVQYFYPMDKTFPYIGENSTDYKISRDMVKIWAEFARTGVPTLPDGSKWPALDGRNPENSKWVQLDNEVKLMEPLERISFLDNFPFEVTEYY